MRQPTAADYRNDRSDRVIVPEHIAEAVAIVRSGLADVLDWLHDPLDRHPLPAVRPLTYVREHLPAWDPPAALLLPTDSYWPKAVVFPAEHRPAAVDNFGRWVLVEFWMPSGGGWVAQIVRQGPRWTHREVLAASELLGAYPPW